MGLFFLKYSSYQSQDSNTVKIGAVLSLSDSTSSFYGENNKNAIDLFVNELNAKGGINGKKVEVSYENSKGDKALALSAFNRLVASGIQYIITDISPTSVAIAPAAQKQHVVLVATSASNPTLTDMGDYIFRTKMSAQKEGIEASNYIVNNVKPKRVAFLYQNDDYGTGVFNTFSENIKSEGISIVADEKFDHESIDMRTSLLKIKEQNPDLVVLAGFPKQIGRILKAAGEMDIHTQFFAHSGSIGPDILDIAGSSAKGLMYLTELHSDTGEFTTFNNEYKNKYGKEAELFSSNAFDAVSLIVQSIKNCEISTQKQDDASCVKDQLSKVSGFKGAAGNITFDQNGDLTDKALILKTK